MHARTRQQTLGIGFCALATGLLGMGATLLFIQSMARKRCRLASRAAAMLLDERRHNLSAEAERLARKFSQWEIRPAAALEAEIRTTLRQRTGIDDIAVFDANGMEIQRFSTNRAPGTRTAKGVMDQEDWRRDKILHDKVPLESYRIVAGRVRRIEACAPILGDGVEGYLVAGVSMDRITSNILHGTTWSIRDGDCLLRPPGGTCRATRSAGRWTVSMACSVPPAWPFLAGGLLAMLASLGLLWFRRARATKAAGRPDEAYRP